MPHKDIPNKASKSYGPYNSFLLKPFLSLSDKTLKIRRNLNITSIISIAITTLGLTVRDINFSGMKIDGVTNDKLLLVLTCILSYHLISFLWYSYDEYWKWRLHLIKEEEISEEKRATGTYSLSPAQIATDKNLYFDVYVVDNIYKDIARITSASLQQVPIESRDHQVVSDYFLSIWERSMKPIINQDLQRLKVYEKSFINYHWQEFSRLLILDWGLPLALGMYSLYNLISCIVTKA